MQMCGSKSSVEHLQVQKGFPFKTDFSTEDWSTLILLSSLLKGGGHAIVLRMCWASLLSAQHRCHQKRLQPTEPHIHWLKKQNRSLQVQRPQQLPALM